MSKKKIEPTDAMVDEAANALCLNATGTSLSFQDYADKHTYRHRARVALRVALNRPDMRGLFADEDTIRAAREQGWDQAVDWIRGEQEGPSWHTTNARLANPHRPAQELPTEDGAVIVPADGRAYVDAVYAGSAYTTRHATYDHCTGAWVGLWRHGAGYGSMSMMAADHITPGTWKVDGEDSA